MSYKYAPGVHASLRLRTRTWVGSWHGHVHPCALVDQERAAPAARGPAAPPGIDFRPLPPPPSPPRALRPARTDLGQPSCCSKQIRCRQCRRRCCRRWRCRKQRYSEQMAKFSSDDKNLRPGSAGEPLPCPAVLGAVSMVCPLPAWPLSLPPLLLPGTKK